MRSALLILAGLLLALVQGNLHHLPRPAGLAGVTPNLVLPLVVYLGVHEPSMARGSLLSFALGHLLDLVAAAPIGLFTFVSVATWWLARVAGVRLTAQTIPTRVFLGVTFALVQGAMVLVLLAIFGLDARRPVELARALVPHALATGVTAPLVFRLAQRLHGLGTGVLGGEVGARA